MPKLQEKFETQNYTRIEVEGRMFRFNGLPDDASDPDGAYSRAIRKAIEPVDALLEDRERLKDDGRFTPKGIRKRLREKAGEYAATNVRNPGDTSEVSLATADGYVQNLRHGLEKKRDRLQGPPTAGSDVEVARDAEMRRHLKEMEPTERRQFLNRAATEERDDVLRAALDAAPELSGLNADHQESIRDRVIRERNPDLVAEIEADMKALNTLERTVQTAQEAIAAIATEPIQVEEEGAAA